MMRGKRPNDRGQKAIIGRREGDGIAQRVVIYEGRVCVSPVGSSTLFSYFGFHSQVRRFCTQTPSLFKTSTRRTPVSTFHGHGSAIRRHVPKRPMHTRQSKLIFGVENYYSSVNTCPPVDEELHEAVADIGHSRGLCRDPDRLEDAVELFLGEQVGNDPGGEEVVHVDEEPLVDNLIGDVQETMQVSASEARKSGTCSI